MNKHGEIIVIEDDADDQVLIQDALKNLEVKNEVLFFPDGDLALEYLNRPSISPFLILSDINLPRLSGMELRERIFGNQELSKKCIPYIFFTTAADEKAVVNAYAFSAQGFFKKPSTFPELQEVLRTIIDYWQKCFAPNQFK